MNEIGLFVSTFGGAGIFIFYLINRDKTTSKQQTDAIIAVRAEVKTQTEAIDDNSFLLFELLDYFIPDFGKRRNVKAIKNKIEDRQYERNRESKENSDI